MADRDRETDDRMRLLHAIEQARTRVAELEVERQRELERIAELEVELAALEASSGIVHELEPPPHPRPVGERRSPSDKLTIFRSLFRGRTDVYPIRFESQTGKAGYAPVRWGAIAAAMVMVAGGCCSGRPAVDRERPRNGSGEPMKDASAETWQRVEVAAGVSVELPAGVATRGEYQGVAYAWHQGAAGVLGVRVGPGQGLDAWRALFQAVPRLAAATAATVCGRPATRQEATFDPGPYAVGVSQDDAGAYVHEATEHPAMTEVAVAFMVNDGTPAVATWRIETAARAAHEAEAARFFAALVCK